MDIQKIRVKNLREISDTVGGITKLADIVDKDKSQISQMIGKNICARFGEKVARNIELKLIENKIINEMGWLDKDHSKENETQLQIEPITEKNLAFLPMIIIESTPLRLSSELYNMHIEVDTLTEKGISIENSGFINIDDRTMEKSIMQGSQVIIDMSKKEIESGKIYLLSINKKPPILRRVYEELDGLRIACDNQDIKIEFPDIEIPQSRINEVLDIVGRGMVVVVVSQL